MFSFWLNFFFWGGGGFIFWGGGGWGGVIFCQDFKINYGIQCSKIVNKYIFNVTI